MQYARPCGKETESVDLAAVVRQSVSICEHLVERGGIQLGVEVDPELPVIQAVGGQLEQVLDQPDHERGPRGRERRQGRRTCADGGPDPRCGSRSPTPARASPKTTASGSSSRSSRRSPTARAPASACRSSATSSISIAGRSRWADPISAVQRSASCYRSCEDLGASATGQKGCAPDPTW